MLAAFIATTAFAQAPSQGPNCVAMLERQIPLSRDQSYEQFDQTEGEGFRRLEQAGCFVEAAQLIDSYLANHTQRTEILRWHAAQMLAKAGRYDAAIDSARRAVLQRERPDFRWNDYVLGTMAFLQRDKAALARYRDRVAEAAAQFPANEPNLRVLNRLVTNFDQPYAVAMSTTP